jgi:hypothetical protein
MKIHRSSKLKGSQSDSIYLSSPIYCITTRVFAGESNIKLIDRDKDEGGKKKMEASKAAKKSQI